MNPDDVVFAPDGRVFERTGEIRCPEAGAWYLSKNNLPGYARQVPAHEYRFTTAFAILRPTPFKVEVHLVKQIPQFRIPRVPNWRRRAAQPR